MAVLALRLLTLVLFEFGEFGLALAAVAVEIAGLGFDLLAFFNLLLTLLTLLSTLITFLFAFNFANRDLFFAFLFLSLLSFGGTF